MKVVFVVKSYCGQCHATLSNEIETDYPISRNTKFYVTPDVALYPKEIYVNFFESKVYVYFVRKFWFWQEKKFDKFNSDLYDVPKFV